MIILQKTVRYWFVLVLIAWAIISQAGDSVFEYWISKAENGDPSAQCMVGFKYVRGIDIPRDYIMAYKWLNLAAPRIDDNKQRRLCSEMRDDVSSLMTRSEIAEAQKLAREWMEKHSKK